MSTLPTRADEAARLAELRRYGILDTPPEMAFDRVADIAATLLQAPIALISFCQSAKLVRRGGPAKSASGPGGFGLISPAWPELPTRRLSA